MPRYYPNTGRAAARRLRTAQLFDVQAREWETAAAAYDAAGDPTMATLCRVEAQERRANAHNACPEAFHAV